MKEIKSNQKGFTLIELLVVIAIIGLLASVVLLSLNSARQKSRDAKRVSDIQGLRTALELYYNDCNSYPRTTGNAALQLGDPTSATTYKLVLGNGNTCGANDGSAIATVGGFYSTATVGTGTTYIGTITKNPTPIDNTAVCTAALSNYTYTPQTISGNVAAGYTLAFCLGAQTGGYAAGARTATQDGI